MKSLYFYDTFIGKVGIVDCDGSITNVFFECDVIPEDFKIRETELLAKAGAQLLEYFSGKRKTFDLVLAPAGTEFQKSVWRVLCDIPYGNTVSYKDVAYGISNEKACRAVGLANNKNPIPLFIPCHRVIGSNGKLVGYRGGLAVKKMLLEFEYGKILNAE